MPCRNQNSPKAGYEAYKRPNRVTVLSLSSSERSSEHQTVRTSQGSSRALVDTAVMDALLSGTMMPADERIELAGHIAESAMSSIDEVVDHALRRCIVRKTIQAEKQRDSDVARFFFCARHRSPVNSITRTLSRSTISVLIIPVVCFSP